jgi:L-alanine-DL-glutamate epimerase-like enolase superfamily enzyme
MSPMKITELRSTVVAVPTQKPPASEVSVGDYRLAVLVEVLTDDGLVGLGEAPNPVGVEATRTIIDSAEPLLLGEDPTDVEKLKKKLYAQYNLTHLHIHAACWALNGIDMALWDLVGKACQKPLYQLWGGAFRKKIEYYGEIRRASPDEVAAEAATRAKEGFTTLYMKIGFDEEEDLACVRAIREAVGPKLKIRVDANQSWSAGEAVRIIRRLGQYGLEFVDQPVLMYNVDALARVRAAVDVPIASHESSWTMYEALRVLQREAADVIHIDPRFDAGFTGARLTAGMAEAAGVPVVMHSFGELGVAQCAYMHLIASTPNFTLANQTGYHRLTDDVIKGGLLRFENGCLDLPERPGIGVDLDPEKVGAYARYYQEQIKGKEFSQPWLTPQYSLMQYRRFFGL